MKNKIGLLVLLFISLPAAGTRIVKFQNNTNYTDKIFSYFAFSFYKPENIKPGTTINPDYSAIEYGFVKRVDLDNLKDDKTKKAIPAGLSADVRVVTTQPSNLPPEGIPPQPIPLTGSQTNLAPGTYTIYESSDAIHFRLITPTAPAASTLTISSKISYFDSNNDIISLSSAIFSS